MLARRERQHPLGKPEWDPDGTNPTFIELGGTDLDSRTVLGNPPNAVENGWEKGVFFMYDPTVETDADTTDADTKYTKDGDAWRLIIVIVCCILGASCVCAAGVCMYRKVSGKAAAGKEAGTDERQRALVDERTPLAKP